jgi:hypothetical protein
MATKSRREQLEEMLADDPDDAFVRYGLAMEHVGEETTRQPCAASKN